MSCKEVVSSALIVYTSLPSIPIVYAVYALDASLLSTPESSAQLALLRPAAITYYRLTNPGRNVEARSVPVKSTQLCTQSCALFEFRSNKWIPTQISKSCNDFTLPMRVRTSIQPISVIIFNSAQYIASYRVSLEEFSKSFRAAAYRGRRTKEE